MAEVAVLPGDGIGREVIPAAIRVLDALDVNYEFTEVEAGDRVKAETGEALPAETRAVVARADATLFGAAGDTAADVILPLRSVVDSFVNIRPARTYPGVDALQPDTDLVILRENTEGVYAGIENRLSDDVSTLTRVITKRASRRLAEYACDYVTDHGYDGFTIAHKANVMRITDGVFVETVEAVATERGVRTDTAIMDALAMLVVMEPAEYDVIVTPNLAGDVISDVAAGLVGGLGLLPSANVGPERAVFEPVHGSAPDIAGDGIANPAAAILSAAMLCEFLGDNAAGERIRDAVTRVLQTGPHTPDLGGNATTDDVTTAIIDHL